MIRDEVELKEIDEALQLMIELPGWKYIESQLNDFVEVQLAIISKAEDPITVSRCAGRIEAARHVLSIPSTYERAAQDVEE